jgi:hypothetical protein
MNRAAIPSLFFSAMFHTDSIITVASRPRMSFKARLLNLAAYFAIVRLLGPRSVGAAYEQHQQNGKGSHDDSSLYVVKAGTTSLARGNDSGLNRTGARSLCCHSLFSDCDFTPDPGSLRGGNGLFSLQLLLRMVAPKSPPLSLLIILVAKPPSMLATEPVRLATILAMVILRDMVFAITLAVCAVTGAELLAQLWNLLGTLG